MIFFGTDGIRGKAYDTLPLLRAYQLGYAIEALFKNKKIIIGYDTRESSLDYVNAILNSLENDKYEVAGIVTSPVIGYYSYLKSCVGIMITASHNPFYDNGLKVFIDGFKIDDQKKLLIEKKMLEKKKYNNLNIHFEINEDIKNQYLNFINNLNLKNTFSDYIVDAANGSASFLSQKLFDGKIYFNQPNGKNINKDCGCTNIEVINKINNEKKVSFSFDGDGDRLLMTLNKRILSGDEIMYLIVKDLIQMGNKPKIACSIMTNPGSIKAFKKLGIDLIETSVGDSYLIDEIKNGRADIGFEPSGHFILSYGNDLLIGDGLLVARKIIDIFSRQEIKTIILWLNEIQLTPMRTENLMVDKSFLNKENTKKCLKEINSSKSNDDKIIIRASGTENLIRITVGMSNQINLEKTFKKIKHCILGENK